MPYLTNAEILSIFGELSKVPRGYESFFNHVDDNVHWEITGQTALSGVWRSKAEFLDRVWLPIIRLIADPGPIFEIACPDSITRNEEGWVNVELKTRDTRTKLGNRLYSQHYSWHCKFNSAKKIVQVRCFFDTSLAETVLLHEKYRQEALAILPNDPLDRPEMGPDYPLIPFDPAYKRFLNEFYLRMDSPNEHEKYSQCFTPDATVIMGEREARGREGIYALRKALWNPTKRCTHRLKQVFPYGPNSNVAMVHGTLDCVFKDGSAKTVDWAARCHFVMLDRVYLSRYQIYIASDAAGKPKSNL
ncbi:hypothetical protein BO83DRAFT_447413 [Aspergillus eucalypticola CBS 122712]|uniref:SnoaL-like domain-containing protein n=1 Tax=Aspergillus eucalypticola (strain CBS 122712 / IBT 29274) TaxID=1448314 RepID=A0A317VCE2_ASPEC|nr:uncharacterized protein BO83DRAFT_447413 [Aspergillus eucalypticola CBS 122712]PWY70658.1 hypothetical protein BO83DRAFT_447413 [Aspergillus eucalypticola CBS 122712]